MLYLLDASVLITANNLYYPIDRIPEFWSWLHHVCDQGSVKIPLELFDEIKDGRKDGEKDLLFAWIQGAAIKAALVLDEEPDVTLVQKVISEGYGNDLTDDEIEQLGRDPFIVAYALAESDKRCVVTTEVSKPKKVRQNRHLPDVCDTMGVRCCDTFAFLRAAGFSTSWKP
jgi:hypothetical protein